MMTQEYNVPHKDGTFVIPKQIRNQLDLREGDQIAIAQEEDGSLTLRKV